MDDVFVSMIDLPSTVDAYVVSNDDATYTVVLNSRLNHERNLEAYLHELIHLKNNDFEKDRSADLIELETHKL